jgi:hypothetical protein
VFTEDLLIKYFLTSTLFPILWVSLSIKGWLPFRVTEKAFLISFLFIYHYTIYFFSFLTWGEGLPNYIFIFLAILFETINKINEKNKK